ncbi:Choline transporter-like protein 2 [Holothuria leucospilota]|uniref:Choline transporter-like protein n=1 Tax=Holothuria leucospilota TaxID=206669 RepID=A0A9Q1C6Z6_HOLLE|nr:Choline transporter-like protein 2 [Holothuria leucospilota]
MGKREPEDDGEMKKYGNPQSYDPSFKGPLHNRSCTDIICLILFIIYIAGMVAVAIIGFISGDPRRLIYPTDSNGTVCGIDESVKNKTFLVFFDLTRCSPNKLSCLTPQVCVEECPDYYYFAIPGIAQDLYDSLNLTVNEYKEFGPICDYSVDIDALGEDNDQVLQLVQENKCAPYVLKSTSVFGRCLPEFIFNSSLSEEFRTTIIKGLSTLLTEVAGTVGVDEEMIQDGINFILDIGGSTVIILEDIQTSWHVIVIGIVVGTVLCFIWCFIMRYIAGIMVWGSILVLNCILAAATALSFFEYMKLKGNDVSMQELQFTLDLNYYRRLDTTWLISTIVCGVIFLILLLLTLCLCNRIRIAIALIEEASRSVTAFWSTLFWPLVPFALEILVIVLWAIIALYLGSATTDSFTLGGNDTVSNAAGKFQEVVCGQETFQVLIENENKTFCTYELDYKVEFKYLQIYNLFGFLWLLNFVIGFSHMTLAGTFATYYWTLDKKNVPSMAMGGSLWRVVRYHLGSIAFGAAIIAIIQLIRIFLEYLEVQLNKGKENAVVKFVLRCLKCLFWCLEKFMKFINKNAYIMVAIYGKNFCTSAKNAFFLLMRNIVRVAVVNKITDFLLFLGTLMVTAGVILIAFFFYAFSADYAATRFIANDIISIPDVRYYWIIIILIGIGTFVVAKLFFGVFDMAVDTLFLCFLEDLERNDGSADRPYYMNKTLKKICGKKNHSGGEEW